MRLTGIRITGLLAIGTVIAGAPEARAQVVDFSGAWTFTVTTETGVVYPEVMLRQDGDRLMGRYSSDAAGQSRVSGSVRGSGMTFTFSVESDEQVYQVVYAGVIEEDRRIIGTVDVGGGALYGTFTAVRRER